LPLVSKCLEMVSYSCPSGNTDPKRQPDFVSAASVKCKPCSASTTITDLHTEEGKFWVGLHWGPLVSDKGAFVETDVTGYSVHIVDSKGRILMTVGSTDKVASANNCCTKDAYSLTVAGTLPTGYSKFMIVPEAAPGKWLPMGILTDVIVDVAAGLATKITGSFTVKVSDAKAFKTNKIVNAALREAVADTLKGVENGNVRITNITTATRRLEELSRRLAAHLAAPGSVKVEFEIVLPATYTGAAIKASSLAPAALMAAINTRLAAKGVGVTVAEAPVIATLKTTSLGTPEATGGAYRSATVGLLAAFAGLMTMFH